MREDHKKRLAAAIERTKTTHAERKAEEEAAARLESPADALAKRLQAQWRTVIGPCFLRFKKELEGAGFKAQIGEHSEATRGDFDVYVPGRNERTHWSPKLWFDTSNGTSVDVTIIAGATSAGGPETRSFAVEELTDDVVSELVIALLERASA